MACVERARGAAPITAGYLYALLRNPFYAGLIVRDDKTYAGEHEPMITPADFERLQRILNGGKSRPRPRTHRDFLFRGHLTCGHCGRLMVGERHAKRTGLVFTYYRCGRRRLGYDACHAPAPSEAEVLATHASALDALAGMPEWLPDWTIEAIDVLAARKREDLEGERRKLVAELELVKKQEASLLDAFLAGIATADDIKTRRGALGLQRVEVERKLANPDAALEAWQHTITDAVRRVRGLRRALLDGAYDEQRDLLSDVYENCAVTDRIPAPTLRFPFSALAAWPTSCASLEGRYENRRDAVESVLNETKKARPGDAAEDALHSWWTSLEDFRTPDAHKRGRDSPSDHRRAA